MLSKAEMRTFLFLAAGSAALAPPLVDMTAVEVVEVVVRDGAIVALPPRTRRRLTEATVDGCVDLWKTRVEGMEVVGNDEAWVNEASNKQKATTTRDIG